MVIKLDFTLKKLYTCILGLLIFFMMLSTQSFNIIKLLLLVLVLILSICLRGVSYYLSNHFFRIIILYVSVNIFSIGYGYIVGAPGALRTITTLVLWPIIFSIIFYTYNDIDFLNSIDKYIVFSLAFITVLDFLYLMCIYGLLPIPREMFLDIDLSYAGIASDHEFSSAHDTSYIYGIPYIMGRFIVEKDIKKKRRFTFLIIPMIAIVFLMGRRGLLLVFILMPIYIYMIKLYLTGERNNSTRIQRKGFMVVLGLVVLAAIGVYVTFKITDLSLSYLITNFLSGFDFRDETQNIRGVQFHYLVLHWLEKPFIGHGSGSGIKEVVRSTEMPWAYELSYMALLYQRGIIGFLAFGLLVYSVYKLNKKRTKFSYTHYRYVFPHLVGIFSFLIANATNPYLGKFSNMWYLIFPLVLSDYSLTEDVPNSCRNR